MKSTLRTIGLALTLAAAGSAAALASCASPSPFAGADPADACAAARAGRAPFQGADLPRGAQVFQAECSRCHDLAGGASRLQGPELHGVVGRPIGSLRSFSYSAAFDEHRGERWTLAALDRYVEDPSWFIADTRMSYAGLPDADQRRDLLAYLACDGTEPSPAPSR